MANAEPDGRDPRPPTGRLIGLVILAAGLAAAALALVVAAAAWPELLSVQEFEELIRSWGMWGVVASIALMVIHTFVPFPAEFVALANGMVYGTLWGTAVTWVGAMLGAVVAFGLARRFGRPFVEHLVAQRDWGRADALVARQGTAAVFIGRFIPVISFNLINWAAGLTRMSWWTFIWATGIGVLPVTFLMVAVGDNIESIPLWGWGAMAVGALFLALATRRLYRMLLA